MARPPEIPEVDPRDHFDADGRPAVESWVAPYRVKEALIRAVVADSKISPAAIRTILVLIDRADPTTGVAWPGRGCTAADAAMSERSIARATAELEAAGWITMIVPSDGFRTARYRPAWERGIARRKYATRESRQGTGLSPVPELAPVPSPSPVPEPSPVPNPAATGDKTGGRRVTGVSPKEKEFEKETPGRKVAASGDVSPGTIEESALKAALNEAAKVDGVQARISRASGVSTDRLRDWRWSRKAVRLRPDQLAIIGTDPDVSRYLATAHVVRP